MADVHRPSPAPRMTTWRARAARLVVTFGATALLATGCAHGGGPSAAVPTVGAVPPGDSPSVRVARLLAATPLVDGHSDLLRHWIECDGCPRDFAAYDIGRRTAGDADIPRMRAGRLGVQLLNVFGPEYTARSTRDGFDLVRRLPERYPADLAIAATADEARRIHASGVDHVGIGSDFDGIDFKVRGLEDAATFPALFAELARRGWTDDELRKLAGENFLRAWERADAAARQPRRGAP